MENSSNARISAPRRAGIGAAILAALGVALFGLGAIPAQEASAAGIVSGILYMSSAEAASPADLTNRTEEA